MEVDQEMNENKEPTATEEADTLPNTRQRRRSTRRESVAKRKPQKPRKSSKSTAAKKKKAKRFEGFCWWCTNPKPTIICASTCQRLFHRHCLEQYLRGDPKPGVLDEQTGEIVKSEVNWNDSDDEDSAKRKLPTSIQERNERNLRRFGDKDEDGKDREESSTTSSEPSLVTLSSSAHESEDDPPDSSLAPQATVSSMDVDGVDNSLEVQHRNSSEIVAAPPYPRTGDPRRFLEKLVNTWILQGVRKAEFHCLECKNLTHDCFICGKNTEKPVVPCSVEDCGKFYHQSCLDKDKWTPLWHLSRKGGELVCPRHRCCAPLCQWGPPLPPPTQPTENEPTTTTAGRGRRGGRKKARKKGKGKKAAPKPQRRCWFCPRAYHRNCVPPKVVLPAMDLRMTADDNVKAPDFMFDLIVCRDHASPPDGLFGRNDERNGILSLNFSAFGVHEDVIVDLRERQFFDPVEHLRAKFEEKKMKINAACPVVADPFGRHFKKLTANKWIPPAKAPKWKKKYLQNGDYEPCDCSDENPCEYNSCYNALSNVECFDGLCNVQGCQNRKFAESKIDESPIIVKQTPDKGRGTFASRDLEQHELVVEYVGEVLTKKEGDKRLEEMNKNGAMNFYFMALSSKFVIDAARQGHVGRFLNHSCIPNCRCDLWDVKGVPRLGIFTNCRVPKGTELTYDYKYEVKNPHPDGKGLQRCMCGAPNCRVFLGFSKKLAAKFRERNPGFQTNSYIVESESDGEEEVVENKESGVEDMDVDEEDDEEENDLKDQEEDQDKNHEESKEEIGVTTESDVEMTDTFDDKENMNQDNTDLVQTDSSGPKNFGDQSQVENGGVRHSQVK